MKTNVERVLDYLWSVSPNGATDRWIEMRLITSSQRDPVEAGKLESAMLVEIDALYKLNSQQLD